MFPIKLNIHDLSAGYGNETVIQQLSLSVKNGEFLSLLGPSGCGKTTLMKTIAGILPAQQGKICLDGVDITNLPIHQRHTVIVFQDMRLFPHLSIEENVAFPLKMQGVSKQERLERAAALLEKVQLHGFEKRKPHELSGGQQQSFPADNSSAPPLPEHWQPSQSCCCWTNPFPLWTKTCGRRCGVWCLI